MTSNTVATTAKRLTIAFLLASSLSGCATWTLLLVGAGAGYAVHQTHGYNRPCTISTTGVRDPSDPSRAPRVAERVNCFERGQKPAYMQERPTYIQR